MRRLLALALSGLAVFAVEARADFAYISDINPTNSQGEVRLVNQVTGQTQFLGNTPVPMNDIANGPPNHLWGLGNDGNFYNINLTSGSAQTTLVGSLGSFNVSINGLVTASNGVVYASGGAELYTVNTGTGAASVLGSINVGGTYYFSSGDLAFAFANNELFMTASGYGTSTDPSTATAFTTDHLIEMFVSGGTVTGVVDRGDIGYSQVYGLVPYVKGTSDFAGYTSDGKVISIDPVTGAGTFLNNLSPNVQALGSASVPEPSSLILGACGLAVVLTLARHRSHERAA